VMSLISASKLIASDLIDTNNHALDVDWSSRNLD
jgi:hypothetical protein